jgi:hypothetical protein
MNAELIARFTGPYNLPGGVVPVVDGVPRWPWDELVARRRLGQVAKLAGLRLTGGEVFVESGSNDTWFLSGEAVLQVCYRGDVDRLVREAELLAVLPGGVPAPAVLDYGRDRLMSWLVVSRVRAATLWHAWRSDTSIVQRSWAGGPPMLPWLAGFYPELFDVPDFGQRHWFYRVGFALRSLIHWPAFAPEPELPKNHGLRQLRHLAEARVPAD